jgi:putative chitinase
LNDALPRYAISTELRVAAFLATLCFESDYFKAVEEYGKGRGKKYGKPAGPHGKIYYGRGPIQLTWLDNYVDFTASMVERGITKDFVRHPELVAEPKWGIEAACYFWEKNDLNKFANKGNFFAIQGLVNRGNAKKQALDYPDRLKLYDLALRTLPDNFSFNTTTIPLSFSLAPLAPAPDGAADPAPLTLSQPAEILPASDPASAPSFFDRAIGKVNWIRDKATEARIDPEKISWASWGTTIATQASGWGLKIWGFLTGNILYIAIGAVLVGVAVWYFSKAKDRVHANKLAFMAPPANVQINEAR